MEEIWKKIDGFTHYEVSNFGRVRSFLNPNRNKNDRSKCRILKEKTKKSGYKFIALYKDSKAHYKHIHRLVAETFIGPSTLNVNHIDSDKSNNKLSNLEFLQQRENLFHCYKSGRGISNHKGKPILTKEEVETIRFFYKIGIDGTVKTLCKVFNKSRSTIHYAATGKSFSFY